VTISVVIATYNRAVMVGECLESLRVQRYEPGDEVIVVDNGSTDDTANVVATMSRRFPVDLRYVREGTPGKTHALNAGLAGARGAILALTDDDVLVANDWIATIRRLFQDPSLALIGGRVDPRWERPAPRWLRVEEDGRYGRMTSPVALFHYGEAQPLGTRTAPGGNMAVRRDVLDAVGGFDGRLGRRRGTLLCGEDHDFSQRVRAAGFRSEYRPELRVQHWIPAERTRVSYYVRWFFWSGILNALLDAERRTGPRPPDRTHIGYFCRRLIEASAAAAASLVAGRRPEAAEHAMDAAFAAGYLTQRLTIRGRVEPSSGRQEIRALRRQAPQLPATSQTPADLIPGAGAGKVYERKMFP
jgi:glycosyltransferase involved in cell wall biosynthesis